MAYKIIHESFWIDPGVKKLSLEARFLFLYLITNPHAHYSGLYYLPESFIREETGMTTKAIRKGFLALKGRVIYDTANSFVWVINMAKHQMTQGNPENMIKGIAKHLRTIPKSIFVLEFLGRYKKEWNLPFQVQYLTHEEPIPESVEGEVAKEGKEAGQGESREGKTTNKGYYENELQKVLQNPEKNKPRIKELAQLIDEEGKTVLPVPLGTPNVG